MLGVLVLYVAMENVKKHEIDLTVHVLNEFADKQAEGHGLAVC